MATTHQERERIRREILAKIEKTPMDRRISRIAELAEEYGYVESYVRNMARLSGLLQAKVSKARVTRTMHDERRERLEAIAAEVATVEPLLRQERVAELAQENGLSFYYLMDRCRAAGVQFVIKRKINQNSIAACIAILADYVHGEKNHRELARKHGRKLGQISWLVRTAKEKGLIK